jgi:cell division protein FtsZ
MKNAVNGLDELRQSVDTIITIPNEKLLTVADDDMSMLEAFRRADDVLLQAVRGISDLIVRSGIINVDFADVRTIMSCTGKALMGTGYGRGAGRAMEAADVAVNSPLLDDISIAGATGILINFTAGPDVKLREVQEAARMVQESAHEDANIIFGLVTDPNMEDVVKVTVIATGFDAPAADQPLMQPGFGHSTYPAQTVQAHAARSVAQQVVRTPSRPLVTQPQPQPRGQLTRPSRGVDPAARPAAPQAEAPAASRVFGAAAIHDEAVLDIPAYLRRARG